MLRSLCTTRRTGRTATSLVGVAAIAAIVGAAPAVARPDTAVVRHPQQVTSFQPIDNFIESIALSPSGALYASVTHWDFTGGTNTGQVYRIGAGGRHIPYGPTFAHLGSYGVLTGLAFDPAGHLYVGVVADGAATEHFIAPGVMQLTATTARRVLTLPAHSFPNGLAVHAGLLYATDSHNGGIWRTDPARPATPQHPWLTDPLLAPATQGELGADGIAFRGSTMTVNVFDPGRIVQAVVPRSGRPTLHLVSSDPRLKTSDGIAYDSQGRLWIAVNGTWTQDPKDPNVFHGSKQYLLTLTRDGKLHTMAANPSWLNFGTMFAFGDVHDGQQPMYLSNGGLYGGPVDILRLHVVG
jgi:sugar lactone lactonase YvrE